METLVYILIPLAVIFGVAIAYDLRGRRHRRLSGEFGESGRISNRHATRARNSKDARDRPTKMGKGPMGGPSMGP